MPTPIKKRKESLNVTISPYLKKKIDALVETEEFSSASDLANTALAEFLFKYDLEKEEMGVIELFMDLLQTDIGKKAIDLSLARQKKHTQSSSDETVPKTIIERIHIE